MPYALFVSSKVTQDKKNPLIVSLHGLGGDQNTMVRETLRSVELAEQGGYILVAPMGYNSGGWYGIPPGPPRAGGPNAAAAAQRGRGVGAPRPIIGGTAITEAAKVREASEKDVMTVVAMIRKEFNVDERRIYLMGHSMGGAGTYYLSPERCAEERNKEAVPDSGSLRPLSTSARGIGRGRDHETRPIKYLTKKDLEAAGVGLPRSSNSRMISRTR